MTRVTLLIGCCSGDYPTEGTAEFEEGIELLNPSDAQAKAMWKYEVWCEETTRGMHTVLLSAVDGLYAQAFFDGFNPNSTVSLVLIDGKPSPIAINDHGFESRIAEPYHKEG